MNTKSLIAFALFASAGTAAMAQDVIYDQTPFHATRTRAEVRAEVLKARADGSLQPAGEFAALVRPAVSAAPSSLTRAQVRAEARAQVRSPRVDNGYYPG